MKRLTLILVICLSTSSFAQTRWQHEFNPPEPVFHQTDFLNIPGIPELNLDFAIAWTDSAAGLFLQPYDAMVLHVEFKEERHDVYIFSDAGMDRLCIWMCSAPDANGHRYPETITTYYGEDCDSLSAPSGITTNSRNRIFDPDNDLIYLADRGNDRILELAYYPDEGGGRIYLNRTIGEGVLEWPVDVAISTYGSYFPSDAELYVVQWGHELHNGQMLRFGLDGEANGHWGEIPQTHHGQHIYAISKPVSIECFPDDDEEGVEDIYVSEADQSQIFVYKSYRAGPPWFETGSNLDVGNGFWQSGGVNCDDYGRVYICNYASGKIDMWEAGDGWPYPSFNGDQSRLSDTLEYPSAIVLDTYYDPAEALIIEKYGRTTGIKSFVVEGGSRAIKPAFGFIGGNLVRPTFHVVPELPFSYKLGNAYPNPFNSACRIEYDIPEQAHVLIEVFNVLGQKVSTLINETKPPGKYSVRFDAAGLSSGTYFYSLKTDNYSKTKSIVLIK